MTERGTIEAAFISFSATPADLSIARCRSYASSLAEALRAARAKDVETVRRMLPVCRVPTMPAGCQVCEALAALSRLAGGE